MSTPWSNGKKLLAGTAFAGLAFAGVGMLTSLPTVVVRHRIVTDKVAAPLRLVVVSDLHSCRYGRDQRKLLDLIEGQQPDAILFPGDILDDILPTEPGEIVLRWAGAHYPCYYVTGNHELAMGDMTGLEQMLADAGVTWLAGRGETLTLGETKLHVFGVDDPFSGQMPHQLSTLEVEDGENFNILIAHRPDRIEEYLQHPFDLVVCGHAHGGQWRVPGLINGVFAPDQGLFPRHAGGLYRMNQTHFVVSRGLARENVPVPRMYNPPELVVIELIPEKS